MRTAIAAAVALAVAHTGIAAQDLTDTAQVISSTPVIERIIEPRQECWQEAAGAPARDRNVAAPIIGGVAGALLGSQSGPRQRQDRGDRRGRGDRQRGRRSRSEPR